MIAPSRCECLVLSRRAVEVARKPRCASNTERKGGVSSSSLNEERDGPMLRLCILIRVLLARPEFVNRKRGHNISRDLPRWIEIRLINGSGRLSWIVVWQGSDFHPSHRIRLLNRKLSILVRLENGTNLMSCTSSFASFFPSIINFCETLAKVYGDLKRCNHFLRSRTRWWDRNWKCGNLTVSRINARRLFETVYREVFRVLCQRSFCLTHYNWYSCFRGAVIESDTDAIPTYRVQFWWNTILSEKVQSTFEI